MARLPQVLRRQTLASFDYQWRELPEGAALVSDPWFAENVDRIIAEELLAMRREWFRGKHVLDAGCGAGRWTIGLLRLGCEVTAVDASASALERARENVEQTLGADALGRLHTRRVDLLHPPADMSADRFDCVFSFGVLHHTGDTRRALENIASLVNEAGVLFLYLYGHGSIAPGARLFLAGRRLLLAPLPYAAKRRLISMVYRRSDPHALFDILSPTINTRHRFDEVRGWLGNAGFHAVTRTIEHSELFLRAARWPAAVEPFAAPLPKPPYWFERYR